MTVREKDGGVVILPMNGAIQHETWSLMKHVRGSLLKRRAIRFKRN